MKIYNGDTFMFSYSCELKEGIPYIIQPQDIVKVIIYETLNETNYISKEFKFNEPKESIDIYIECEKMKKLKCGNYTIEIKIINTSGTFTTYQEEIFIKESWCIDD